MFIFLAALDKRAQPTDLVLSLVGTTAIGFNLFLGGEMAKGRTLIAAQRGILFSVVSAMIVSQLIMMVGAGQFNASAPEGYSIQGLSRFIKYITGTEGVVVFALGFMAAALSSMITVILGANITARSIFFDEDTDPVIFVFKSKISNRSQVIENKNAECTEDSPINDPNQVNSVENKNPEIDKEVQEIAADPKFLEERTAKLKRRSNIMVQSINVIQTAISVIVIAANADRLFIILVAQVFNGALLPFFSICLLLCINDQEFMGSSPQKWYANIFLFISVTISLFLSCNTILEKVLGSLLALSTRLYVALTISVVGMSALCLLTTLGRNILDSFRRRSFGKMEKL